MPITISGLIVFRDRMPRPRQGHEQSLFVSVRIYYDGFFELETRFKGVLQFWKKPGRSSHADADDVRFTGPFEHPGHF